MRFSVPRSVSPSPERKPVNLRGCFRAPEVYDTDSSDSDNDSPDEGASGSVKLGIAASSTSSDGASAFSEGEDDDCDDLLTPWNNLRINGRTPDEDRVVSEAVNSIRNHARHTDPYEDWESQTRRDAFLTARKQQSSFIFSLREAQKRFHEVQQYQFDAAREKEAEYFRHSSEKHQNNLMSAEKQLRERWKERDQKNWDRIEQAIKEEEDKARAAHEAECKAKEEEERKRKEEEEMTKKTEEELKRAEEEEKKEEQERTKKEEEQRLEVEKEEMEKAWLVVEEKERKSEIEGLIELREQTGVLSCDDMWKVGLRCLKYLKTVTMRSVKGPRPPDPEPAGYQAPPPPPLKKLWSAQRRKITPKIGQLTDDPREIARISEEIKAIVAPVPGMPRPEDAQNLHHALLASFSKAVIAQAETEVTAHKASARPLALVAVALIRAYPELGDIFWARICARVGCWAAGVKASVLEDETHETLPAKDKRKRWGICSLDESKEDIVMRISGVMRLYFAMLFGSLEGEMKDPMPAPFRPGRYWLYLTQLLSNESMLGRSVAPEVIYVALDECGAHAKALWGKQFVKVLQVIWEGINSEEGKTKFGGTEVLAQASRARCVLEIDKIMARS